MCGIPEGQRGTAAGNQELTAQTPGRSRRPWGARVGLSPRSPTADGRRGGLVLRSSLPHSAQGPRGAAGPWDESGLHLPGLPRLGPHPGLCAPPSPVPASGPLPFPRVLSRMFLRFHFLSPAFAGEAALSDSVPEGRLPSGPSALPPAGHPGRRLCSNGVSPGCPHQAPSQAVRTAGAWPVNATPVNSA